MTTFVWHEVAGAAGNPVSWTPLCLPPDAGLSSGFAPLATVPSRVNPCGCGVAFFRLSSRCDVGHSIIFRLRRRWGLHYLSIAGAIYP